MTGFIVYPAIDVRDGRVVRLAQGDYARETRYEGAPLQVAQRYAAQGAEWLHLVDLDAARAGGYTLAPLLGEMQAWQALPYLRCNHHLQEKFFQELFLHFRRAFHHYIKNNLLLVNHDV